MTGERTNAEVEVAWTERGSTGNVYEIGAVFLIDGDEDTTTQQFCERAGERAEEQVLHRVFIEVLESKLLDSYIVGEDH